MLTDITGVTGQAILRAIVHGERDPLRLAQLRTAACKSSADVIAKALTGTWRDEQVFILTQALDFFDFYTRQIAACDAQIERQFAAMKPRFTSDEPSVPLPRVKPGSKSKNQPSYNARTYLARLTGVDLVAVTGISASIAQTILAEVGTDMSKFPDREALLLVAGACPAQRHLRRQSAALADTESRQPRHPGVSPGRPGGGTVRLGLRCLFSRDAGAAGTAASHRGDGAQDRTGRVSSVKHHEAFTAESAAASTRQRRERELKHLTRRASTLGYTLTPVAASQPAGVV